MKTIKKIGALLAIFILNFYNKCFADVVWIRTESYKDRARELLSKPTVPETEPVNYVLIGIIVLVVVICAVFIIRRIIKQKKEKEKEKENDNK